MGTMLQKAIIALILLCFAAGMSAQDYQQLDPFSRHYLKQQPPANGMLHLIVKAEKAPLQKAVAKVQGTYKYGYDNIHAVRIPTGAVDQFLQSEAVQSHQPPVNKGRRLMDEALDNNNITPIHQGASPLDTAYTGKDIIIGIIDDGIDITHPDFMKPNGDTRIRFMWDMLVATQNPPAPYDYGREWTELDINAGNCTHEERANAFSHGTNVAGIACGNARATGNYKGVAPESDMIIVAFNYNRPDFLATFADAANYIFKKADAMGRPCVINASLGTYIGARDGKDLTVQMIDAMLEERNGRVLVAAGGNAGNIDYHLSYEVTADTQFTWFRPNPVDNNVYIELWADPADFDSVYFSLTGDNPVSYTTAATTEFLNVQQDYNLNNADSSDDKNILILDDQQNFVAVAETEVAKLEGRYRMRVLIDPDDPALNWRLSMTGQGTFDIWSHANLMGYSDMVTANLPTQTQFPPIVNYVLPDNDKTIVSGFQCSDKVITVANYVNKTEYTDYNGDTVNISGQTTGDIAPASSWGPTRDGRFKPDVAATGNQIFSSGNQTNTALLLQTGQFEKVAPGGYHTRNGGTSMASPIVAGLAALYLEKYPDANWRKVKEAVIESAVSDTFTTGQLPNKVWGHGKVNGFEAMQLTYVCGCTDPNALNYDPAANLDDGSCIAVVEGCTDPNAVNYNPDANVDDGSCQYVGVNELADATVFELFPNPSDDVVHINYELPEGVQQAAVRFTTLSGQQVGSVTLGASSGTVQYHFDEQAAGIYILELHDGTTTLLRKKVVIY